MTCPICEKQYSGTTCNHCGAKIVPAKEYQRIRKRETERARNQGKDAA